MDLKQQPVLQTIHGNAPTRKAPFACSFCKIATGANHEYGRTFFYLGCSSGKIYILDCEDLWEALLHQLSQLAIVTYVDMIFVVVTIAI